MFKHDNVISKTTSNHTIIIITATHQPKFNIVTWIANYITKVSLSDITLPHSKYICYLFVNTNLHDVLFGAAGGQLSSVLFYIYLIRNGLRCLPRWVLPASFSGRPLLHIPPWLPMVPFPLCDSIHSSSCSIMLTYCIGRWMKTEPWFYFIAQYIQNPTTFILSWPSKDYAPPGPYLHPRWV
jgi:hypothetical protein